MSHPLIAECESLGITISASSDGLVVIPASKLSAELRAKLAAAKPALLAELSNISAQIIPICWPEFVQQCVALGVTSDEVRAMFNHVDIQDLCNESPANIDRYVKDIVVAIRRERRL